MIAVAIPAIARRQASVPPTGPAPTMQTSTRTGSLMAPGYDLPGRGSRACNRRLVYQQVPAYSCGVKRSNGSRKVQPGMAIAARTRSAEIPAQGGGRLASPAVVALMRQRTARLGGLMLGLLGLTFLLALASYDPRDPSFDTATARHATNLAGPVGALLADLLLQGFGLAAALPGLAMLAWAWRIAAHRGIGSVTVRLAATLAALPVLAAALAAIPLPQGAAWPTVAGLGGAIGVQLDRLAMQAGRTGLGPLGGVLVWVLGLTLAGTLTLLALGLTAGEWRAAGRTAVGAARVSVSGGRAASGRLTRVMARLGTLRTLFHRRAGRRARDMAPYASMPEHDPVETPFVVPPDHAPPRPSLPRSSMARGGTSRGRQPRPVQGDLPLDEPRWRFPSLSLLKPAPARATTGPSVEARAANAQLLVGVLADYGVQGTIDNNHPGPVVTLYELVPAAGIRSARVIGLADDVARSLSVTAVRIATVPGRNVIGIEVPNARRETVYLSEIFASEAWSKQQS